MSSILKALKKLEEDKVRRGERAVDLAIDIHRGGQRRRQRGFPWWGLAAVVFAVMMIGVVWVSTHRQTVSSSVPEKAIANKAAAPESSVPPSASASENGQVSPASSPKVSAAASSPPPARIPPLKKTQSPVRPPVSSSSQDTGTAEVAGRSPVPGTANPGEIQLSSRQPSNAPVPSPNASVLSATGSRPVPLAATAATSASSDPSALASPAPAAPGETTAPKGPELRLTGIVWQDDPAERMAIINDLPVMVGTVIGGATVEKIQTDRVFVRLDGEEKELVLHP